MDWAERKMWMRVERRIAQMCGEALAEREMQTALCRELDPMSSVWATGLIRAWKQVHRIVETGEVVNVDNVELVKP